MRGLLLLLFLCVAAAAQSGFEGTWKFPVARHLVPALAGGASGGDPGASKFQAGPDPGVMEALAQALTSRPQDQAAILQQMKSLRGVYDQTVATQGRSHDLAAAFTYFMVCNLAVYSEMEPTDQASEALYAELVSAIASTDLATLSDGDKQEMHDWLVAMGGLSLATYVGASMSKDPAAIANARELAASSLRLVFGVEAQTLSLGQEGLTVLKDSATGSVVGTWTRAYRSSSGGIVDSGSRRARYIFAADGTYQFKSESWGGPLKSREWWTVEESGRFRVEGERLVVMPSTCMATLRDSDGQVQVVKERPKEQVTYTWQLQYLEGREESDLVLTPPGETVRDGNFAADSNFPNSYLYSRGDRLEWR